MPAGVDKRAGWVMPAGVGKRAAVGARGVLGDTVTVKRSAVPWRGYSPSP